MRLRRRALAVSILGGLGCCAVMGAVMGAEAMARGQETVPAVEVARVHRGAMRHVQIVSLPDSDQGRGLVASASHLFKRKDGGGLERDGCAITLHDSKSGNVLETMAVEGSFLPGETFTQPRLWRFFQAGRHRSVARVEGGELTVVEFPTGEVRGRTGDAIRVLDGRVFRADGGELRLEVLFEGDAGIRRAEFDQKGGLIEATLVSATGVTGAFVGTFARSMAGTAVNGIAIVERPWGEDAVGAGVRVLDRDGKVLREIDLPGSVEFDDGKWSKGFRCAAWQGDEGLLVAFAQPSFDRSVGRLTMVDLSQKGGESLLYDGIPWERILSNTVNQSDFGHCLGFVRDVDGDGLADLVVGTPTHGMGLPALYVMGSEEGELLTAFHGEFFDRVGASVSIGPMGRRALVGVVPPGYPDDLSRPGYACMLEVPGSAGEEFNMLKRYVSAWSSAASLDAARRR